MSPKVDFVSSLRLRSCKGWRSKLFWVSPYYIIPLLRCVEAHSPGKPVLSRLWVCLCLFSYVFVSLCVPVFLRDSALKYNLTPEQRICSSSNLPFLKINEANSSVPTSIKILFQILPTVTLLKIWPYLASSKGKADGLIHYWIHPCCCVWASTGFCCQVHYKYKTWKVWQTLTAEDFISYVAYPDLWFAAAVPGSTEEEPLSRNKSLCTALWL